MEKTNVVFLIGPTNAGKSTLTDIAINKHGAYGVFVGKMLRAKYGEAFFKGQAAPEHTKAESLKLMDEGIKHGLNEGNSLILVDGQPRSDDQLTYIIDNYIKGELADKYNIHFVLLYCEDDVRRKRMEKRDLDEDARKLSEQRFLGDMPQIYKTIYNITKAGYGHKIHVINSEFDEVEFGNFHKLITEYQQI